MGIGTGVTVDSAINTDPRDLASRDAIDRNAPNPNICQTYGSSAMVVDQRVFVTFNPFSLHVSQVHLFLGLGAKAGLYFFFRRLFTSCRNDAPVVVAAAVVVVAAAVDAAVVYCVAVLTSARRRNLL